MPPTNLDELVRQIQDILPGLQYNYYRLALVVGKPKAGKTRVLQALHLADGSPLINVNLQLSERLLDHTVAERPRLVPQLLREIVQGAGASIVLLDNSELLFDARLQLNPLQILQSISRNVTLAASWSGSFAGGYLIYAEPGHPEHRRYPLSPQDAVVFPIGN